MIADKSKPYKREYFIHRDVRFRGCDAIVGILKWCNEHENFIEIVQIIKTRHYYNLHEYSYELIYREW